MAAGAYGTAISYTVWGWPLWASLLFGILASVVLGILLGLPTLRLRGDYLAIVTIAASEIIRLTIRSEAVESVTGGNSGINEFATGFMTPISSPTVGAMSWVRCRSAVRSCG